MADDNMRIIPERDEVRGHARSASKQPPSTGRKPSSSSKKAPVSQSSGISFSTFTLGFFVVLLAGACAFLYVLNQDVVAENSLLADRVAEIESKLSVTDESLSES